MQLSRPGWEGAEGVEGNCKSQSFFVVASSKGQPLPLQLWLLSLWTLCCGHIQKLKQRREMMQCHKDLKIPLKAAKIHTCPQVILQMWSFQIILPPVPEVTCLAVGGDFILNWWIREESLGKIICLHLSPSDASDPACCFHFPLV